MISRSHRTPLLALLGATGALTLVACSAADEPTVSRYRTTTGSTGSSTGDTTTGGSTPSGSSSNGDTSNPSTTGGGGSSSSGTAATGSSSGSSGSSSGSSSGGGGETGGSDAGSTTTTSSTPSFDILVDNAAPTIKLADTQIVQVTVTPTNNWTGDVALTLDSLPSDVTGTFDTSTVTLGAAATTVKLTLKSLSSTAPVATPFSVIGTAGAITHNAAINVTVQPDLTISIPVNVDSLKPGFGTLNIKAPANIATTPVTIHFLNLDSTPHEIHASNPNQGFAHGDGTFNQNAQDPKKRAITTTGTYKFYLHDEGPGINPGTIVIQ